MSTAPRSSPPQWLLWIIVSIALACAASQCRAQIQNFAGAIALGEELIAQETPERSLLKEIAATGYLKAKATSDQTGLQERIEAIIAPKPTTKA